MNCKVTIKPKPLVKDPDPEPDPNPDPNSDPDPNLNMTLTPFLRSQYPDSKMFFGIYMNGIRGEPGMTLKDVRQFVHTERVAHCAPSGGVESGQGHIVTLSKDLDGYRGATKYTNVGSNSLCGFSNGRGTDLPVWTENIPGQVTHMQAHYSGISHAAGHVSRHALIGLYRLFGNAQQDQNPVLKRLETSPVNSINAIRAALYAFDEAPVCLRLEVASEGSEEWPGGDGGRPVDQGG